MANPGEHPVGGADTPFQGRLAAGKADFAESAELADSPEGRRIEQKLRAEALARRGGEDEDAAVEDPTGHA
jgi:hypothetical protein